MPISKWEGNEALPIRDQALIVLKKLKMANIGQRKVIFITHSFGGLVVKQLLEVKLNYFSNYILKKLISLIVCIRRKKI